jgi:hypothetical protein
MESAASSSSQQTTTSDKMNTSSSSSGTDGSVPSAAPGTYGQKKARKPRAKKTAGDGAKATKPQNGAGNGRGKKRVIRPQFIGPVGMTLSQLMGLVGGQAVSRLSTPRSSTTAAQGAAKKQRRTPPSSTPSSTSVKVGGGLWPRAAEIRLKGRAKSALDRLPSSNRPPQNDEENAAGHAQILVHANALQKELTRLKSQLKKSVATQAQAEVVQPDPELQPEPTPDDESTEDEAETDDGYRVQWAPDSGSDEWAAPDDTQDDLSQILAMYDGQQ